MNNDLGISDDICRSVNQDLDSRPNSELDNFTNNELSNIYAIIKILNRKQADRHLSSPQSIQLMELNRAYNSKKLVLVLGSGVSTDCGLPDWDKLLKKIQKNMRFSRNDLEDQALIIDKTFFKLFDRSELILARNFQGNCSYGLESNDSMIFEKFVRCALYEGTKLKYTKLLSEIIRLSSFNEGEKFLDCIITYNYDDILEYFLEKKNKINYKFIYYSEMENKGEFPIYHVHGFLPRKGSLTDKNKIILAEEAYHFLYNNIYIWNNEIQLGKFTNNKCLLIGLSLKDPNLRRLLDAAKKERNNDGVHHIIALRKELNYYRRKLKKFLKNDNDILNEKNNSNLEFEETAKELRELDEKFFEKDALSLGVQTIWAENRADIGKKLQQIKMEP
jgi:hypothetical protein